MNFLLGVLRRIVSFFGKSFLKIAQIIIGVFMVLIGLWFVLAPVTHQFLTKQEALQDAPFLWLIIPVGIIQIFIGLSMLKPLFPDKTNG